MMINTNISLAEDCLVREGAEIIKDQAEPAGSAPIAMDASIDSEQSGQSGIKKCKLSSWLKD